MYIYKSTMLILQMHNPLDAGVCESAAAEWVWE